MSFQRDRGGPRGRLARELNEQLFAIAWSSTSRGGVWQPPTDVYEAPDAIVVKIEIAGIEPGSVELSLADRVLTVSGVREDLAPKLGYHRMEIPYGRFRSRVVLPRRVDAGKIRAEYENGFLTITVPKVRPVRVQVDDGSSESHDSGSDESK